MAGLVWGNERGESAASLTTGTPRFDGAGGLVELEEVSRGRRLVEGGNPVDVGADADLAWGRWTGGKSNARGSGAGSTAGNGDLKTLHYFIATAVPSGATAGRFTSFASTSPTVQSGNRLVATGAVNGATGSFTAALVLDLAGTATYSLSVPVSGQTFSLTGTATQTTLTSFSGVSVITSTGTGCLGGCTGSLGGNISVIGQIAGTGGTQAGVIYGFDSRLGNVSGVIVFRR